MRSKDFWAVWPCLTNTEGTESVLIAGTSVRMRFAAGDVAEVMSTFAAMFNERVERLDGRVVNDWSFCPRPVRGSSTSPSRHHGYGMDLNADQHAQGARGTFSWAGRKNLRVLLDWFEGVIRWGGDYVSALPDEMHFEIDASPQDVARIAHKCRAAAGREQEMPLTREDIDAVAKRVVELVFDRDLNVSAGGRTPAPDKHFDVAILDMQRNLGQINETLGVLKAALPARAQAKAAAAAAASAEG